MVKLPDRRGVRFGKLLVLDVAFKDPSYGTSWKCLCDCGNETIVRNCHLVAKHTTSCGCRGKSSKTTHNKSYTPEYRVWRDMKNRCDLSTNSAYKNYGGRGITYVERWSVFENFYNDMGPRPTGTTLDRIDNQKDYSPENCRWATMKQQQNNKRTNRFITLEGVTKTVTEWAETLGIPVSTFRYRLKHHSKNLGLTHLKGN